MNCKKCGAELIEGSLFCNKCGEKILVEEVEEAEEIKVINSDITITADQTHAKVEVEDNIETNINIKKKFITPVKVIFSTVMVVIVILAFSAHTITKNNQYNQKMNQADALATSGKYKNALTVYEEALKIKTNSEAQIKINKALLLKKSQIALKKSADDFTVGMGYFNTDNYETASKYFKAVIKADSKNYKIAVGKIKQCIKLEDESAIRQAQKSTEDAELQARTQEPTIGMTKDKVRKGAWGEPQKINRTTTADGTTEQWVYDGKYLYFDVNGLLTDIQD
ncbi:zinc ribbon domain-containing protein [Clostridium estertheticum]|uniref:zinc ribbon domain-containing protein n=1 Tax=Clostridium estertheticum TaxID=238834 RepID=UPI001CF497D6|nr:zinc ribbon domain-containing protein [Clostridium estertheticum]MCB2361572.1 zinc-ribbon domain-containing protein [Clostridium estertheticum]